MRRKDREQDDAFARAVLDRCAYATLAMVDEEGAPYCIPISPVMVDGDLCFHSARHGRKADLMRANPTVCVSAACDTRLVPEEFTTEFASAVATGRAVEVTDDAEKVRMLRALCERYAASNMGGFDEAIERSLKRTAVWKVSIGSITGKAKQRPA